MKRKMMSFLLCFVLTCSPALASDGGMWAPESTPDEVQSDSENSKEQEVPLFGYLGNLSEPVFDESQGAMVYQIDVDGDGVYDLTVLDENVIRVKVPSSIYAVYLKDIDELMGLELEDDGKTATGQMIAPTGAIKNMGSSKVNVALAGFKEELGQAVNPTVGVPALATAQAVRENMTAADKYLYSLTVVPGNSPPIDVAEAGAGGGQNMFTLEGSVDGASVEVGRYTMSGGITNALYLAYGNGRQFDATQGQASVKEIIDNSVIQGKLVYRITLAPR